MTFVEAKSKKNLGQNSETSRVYLEMTHEKETNGMAEKELLQSVMCFVEALLCACFVNKTLQMEVGRPIYKRISL